MNIWETDDRGLFELIFEPHNMQPHREKREAMPDQDQMSGTWEQAKGRSEKAWSELTDDDLLGAKGSIDKIEDIIQKTVGDTKESIEKTLSDKRVR